ncbi:MAG: hypothetical protein JSV38_09005 [Desulfobacterales bacterium]|nr:MAG: hypothetical protein JSV38_09005 [Desulfobacterales bacterium]
MTYCFHFLICFALVILQTTVMPYFSIFDRFYDLLFPFIVFLSLFRSSREGIPVVLFFGFVMDTLSGGPFGLYLTTYLWLFVGVKWMITFLDVGDSVLLLFVVAMGVLIQNLIVVWAIAIFDPLSLSLSLTMNTIAVQLLWAIFTGPILLLLFNYSHTQWDNWYKQIFVKK